MALHARETADRGVTFAFLLEDGSLTEDGELDLILPAHQGKEEADRLLAEWAGSFAPLALGRRQPFRRAKRAIRSYGLWGQSPTPEQGIVRIRRRPLGARGEGRLVRRRVRQTDDP
jgi:hypothetical protein